MVCCMSNIIESSTFIIIYQTNLNVKTGKYGSEITPYLDTFYAVITFHNVICSKLA